MQRPKSLITATALVSLVLSLSTQVTLAQTSISQAVPGLVFTPTPAPTVAPTAVPVPIPSSSALPHVDARDPSMQAHLLLMQGLAAEEEGKFPKAMHAYRQVVDVGRTTSFPNYDVATAAGRLGVLHASRKEWSQAMEWSKRSIQEFERVEGPVCTDIGIAFNNIAWINDQLGLHQKAQKSYQSALLILELAPDRSDDLTGIVENNYGDLLSRQNRCAEALKHYRASYQYLRNYFGADYALCRMVRKKMDRMKHRVSMSQTARRMGPRKVGK